MYIMEVNHLPSHCNWLKLSRNWMCLCAQRCVYYAGGGAFQAPKSSAKVQLWMSVCARVCIRTHLDSPSQRKTLSSAQVKPS